MTDVADVAELVTELRALRAEIERLKSKDHIASFLNIGRGGSEIKRLFSKPVVKLAIGAVGAGFVTSLIVNKFGANLPYITSPVGRVGYRLGIPLLAAAITRRFDANLANGMIIGAAVSGVNEIIRIIAGAPSTVPVLASRQMANNAGLVGAGGRGAGMSGYVGYDGDEEDFAEYADTEEYSDMAEYSDDSDDFAASEWD